MSAKVASRRGATKLSDCRKRQSNCRNRQPISPVMQKMKDLLGSSAAPKLHLIIHQPVSTCEKMLCGARPLNPRALRELLRSKEYAAEVLVAFVGEDAPIAKDALLQRDVRAAGKLLKSLQARGFE